MKARLNKLYNSKAFWAIVSLIASLVIWVYVSSVETEEFKQTFRGVRVELAGETLLRDSKNLVVTDMETEGVYVNGAGRALKKLFRSNYEQVKKGAKGYNELYIGV